MIAALWHRWFDAREYRRALRIAEGNYSRTLARFVEVRSENETLRRTNSRLVVAVDTCEREHR